MVVVVNDPKLKPWQRLTHRTHLTQGVPMEERQGCIDSFSRAYAGWFPQLHNIGWVNALVDGAFRRASGAGGVEDVVGRDSNMWIDGRPTSPSFEPSLNGDRITHG